MCLGLYDYQDKASRYRKGLTYLKNRTTRSQNQTIHSQKLKRRGHKHKINIQSKKETQGRAKDIYQLKVRGWKKIFHGNGKDRKAGVAIHLSQNRL